MLKRLATRWLGALLLTAALVACVPNEPMVITSPDKSVQVYLQIDHNNSLVYLVSYQGRQVVGESHLGAAFVDADFTSGVTLGEITRSKKVNAGELSGDAAIGREARQKELTLINRDNQTLVVRLWVGDKGVAIQYRSPVSGALVEEATSLRLAPNAQVQYAAGEMSLMAEAAATGDLPVVAQSGAFRLRLLEVPVRDRAQVVWPAAQIRADSTYDALRFTPRFASNPDAPASEQVSAWRVIQLQPQAR